MLVANELARKIFPRHSLDSDTTTDSLDEHVHFTDSDRTAGLALRVSHSFAFSSIRFLISFLVFLRAPMRPWFLICFSVLWSIQALHPVGCAICLETASDAYTAVTHCGHCFHPDCLRHATTVDPRRCPTDIHPYAQISHDLDVEHPLTLPVEYRTNDRMSTVLSIGFQLAIAARLGKIDDVHHLLTRGAKVDINFAVPGTRQIL